MSNYMQFLGHSMDVASLARKATSDNVANYNTPNYKAVEVDFVSFFQDENAKLKQTNDKHIGVGTNGDGAIHQEMLTEEGSNGNNVDLNKEMAEMIKNNYRFNMVVTAFNKEAGMIRKALGN